MTKLKTFKDLKFKAHPKMIAGFNTITRINFKNKYGVSVITGSSAYSDINNPYEVAILHNNLLSYDTPITDDVIGHCSESKVTEIMKQVQEL